MMKEHPFVVTTTLQGDGDTIKYDITKPGRSDAVGKAFKINADGKGELVDDGDEIDGKVLDVDDDHKFTAAYMFGGLRFPIGDSETVGRGDKIIGALGAGSAKGHVKGVSDPTALPEDLDAVGESDIGNDANRATAINAGRTQINAVATTVSDLITEATGKGNVLEVDSVHALVAFPG